MKTLSARVDAMGKTDVLFLIGKMGLKTPSIRIAQEIQNSVDTSERLVEHAIRGVRQQDGSQCVSLFRVNFKA